MTRVALVVGLICLLVVAPATARVDGARTSRVTVRLSNATLTLTPSKIPVGLAVFRVFNNGKVARSFAVAGKRTPLISAGKSATLAVNLRARGARVAVSRGPAHAVLLTAVLTVFEPCLHPAVTTVGIKIDHDRTGITLSRPTIPCGTVTFVVTNIGAVVDSLEIFTDYPQPGVKTPELAPGQTARVTLRLPEKGIAYYQSGDYPPGEPEYDGSEADGGQVSIV